MLFQSSICWLEHPAHFWTKPDNKKNNLKEMNLLRESEPKRFRPEISTNFEARIIYSSWERN